MHNAVVGKVNSFQQITKFRDTLNQCLSYEMYNKWIPARNFDVGGGASKLPVYTEPVDGVSYPGYVLPGGSDGWITAVMRRHAEWRKGRLAARIHYSAISNAGSFSGKVRISQVKAGDAMPNDSFVAIDLPSPASSGAMKVHNPALKAEWFAVKPECDLVVVSIGRRISGGDAQDLYIIGVELIYQEDRNFVSNKTSLAA